MKIKRVVIPLVGGAGKWVLGAFWPDSRHCPTPQLQILKLKHLLLLRLKSWRLSKGPFSFIQGGLSVWNIMALTQQSIVDVSYLRPKMLFGPSAGLNFLINELVSTSFHSTKIISSFLLVTFNKIAYHSKNLGSKKIQIWKTMFPGRKKKCYI